MPGQIRSNKKAMAIVYKVLKTDKEQQQNNKKAPLKVLKAWRVDTIPTR